MAVKCRVLESGICSITQPYHINGQKGYDYDHEGIDITDFNGYCNVLGWIVAHSDGVVVAARNDCTGFQYNSYGNYVIIQHANNMFTLYAHLTYGTVQVQVGQQIKKGKRVGYMGNTGTSYGGHLHFEVRQSNGNKIDPEPYLNAELPNNVKNVFYYKTYDNKRKAELPVVENDEDYAGVYKHSVGGVRITSNAKVRYAVHLKDKKVWSKEVKNTVFVGQKGKSIDGLILFSSKKAAYRVHLLKSKKWLPWIKTKKSNYDDPIYGYAGSFGEVIDAIQIKPL